MYFTIVIFLLFALFRKYEIEHQQLLNKKREDDQKLLDEALEKAKADLEQFEQQRKQLIEEAKKRNRFFFLITNFQYLNILIFSCSLFSLPRDEEAEFLEGRRTAVAWVAAADMCDFHAAHTKDVDRMKRTMLRMKGKASASAGDAQP